MRSTRLTRPDPFRSFVGRRAIQLYELNPEFTEALTVIRDDLAPMLQTLLNLYPSAGESSRLSPLFSRSPPTPPLFSLSLITPRPPIFLSLSFSLFFPLFFSPALSLPHPPPPSGLFDTLTTITARLNQANHRAGFSEVVLHFPAVLNSEEVQEIMARRPLGGELEGEAVME